MRTRIAIDPNVRVRGNETYAGFEDVRGKVPDVGVQVEVWEPESGVVGVGKVTEIDQDRQLVYVKVDWTSLHHVQVVQTLGTVTGNVTIGPVRVYEFASGEFVEVGGEGPEVVPELLDA